MRRIAVFVLLVFASLVVFGCESTEEDKPTYDELIGFGKKYLERQDAVSAAEAFEAALKLDPNGVDAKYGLFLANIMQVTNLFSNLLDLVEEAEGLDTFGGDEPIGPYLQEFLRDVLEPGLAKNEELFLDLAATPDLLFQLGSYKLTIGEDVLIDWHGRFKQPELHLLSAVSALIAAAIHIVNAHNLEFDPSALDEIPPLSDDLWESLGAILEFLEDLMYDPNYPRFLYLKESEEGVVRMQAAGLLLGSTWFRIIEAFELASAQEGSRLDDPITYEDANFNGVRDPDEPLIIHGTPMIAELLGELEGIPPDQVGEDTRISGELAGILEDLFSVLGAAFLDESSMDIFPDEPNPIMLADLNPLLVYFEIVPFPIPFLDLEIFTFYPGPFFANPESDGLRSLLEEIIGIYDLLDIFL